MAKLLKAPKKIEAQTDIEFRAIHEGVRIYLKNLKAAVGTATGLGEQETASRWRENAEHLEQELVPRLNEMAEAFADGVGPLPLAEAAT